MIIAIPTTGRPNIVVETVRAIAAQDLLPDLVILSIAAPEDVDSGRFEDLPFPLRIIQSDKKGAPHQRNAAIRELERGDYLLFLDDDFLMSSHYLRRLKSIFDHNPDIAMVTGTVLADGIGGRGYDFVQGRRLLAARQNRQRGDALVETYNGYGCNMAVRLRHVFENDIFFDENLPLYGWLEDLDFSRRLSAFGRIVRAEGTTGVHLGTKTGRGRGVMLGYSQIANPTYLVGKGTMRAGLARRLMGQNILANAVKSLYPEPWVDRRGRLKGNILAVIDMLRGRMAPGRVLDL
jgi:GT2 family glycosyltransferase